MVKNNMRWIDFDVLPHKKSLINWEKSVGYEVDFVFNGIFGKIKILSYDIKNKKLCIYIDNYTSHLGYQISTCHFRKCQLGRILRQPIYKTHPNLIQYFVNENDAKTHYCGEDKYVLLKCPFCGTIKKQRINNLVNKGFSCPSCSDGISWPNKFMFNILKQLDVSFINEVNRCTYGFSWIPKQYRYDFYLETESHKLLIELDGALHNNNPYIGTEKQKEIDKFKNNIANDNGIKVIRINCNYSDVSSRFEFVKNQIINSELRNIVDLRNIDWDDANKKSLQSNIILSASMWNDNISITDIAFQLGIHSTTVSNYLKIASQLNLCDYSVENSIKRRSENVAMSIRKVKSKHVAVYKNGELLNMFFNAQALSDVSIELYGVFMNRRNICSICNNKRKHIGGYIMKYVTEKEYEQYCKKDNNTKLLKEVC